MRYIRNIIILVLALTACAGCASVQEPDYREHDYGYVQFKLYKEASYGDTKAVVTQLDYLHEATKVKVMLKYEGNQISQTLVLRAADDEAAEYGMRSDKLQLLAGEYTILAFSLYDNSDEVIYEGTPGADMNSFEVVAGGLVVHDILANVTPRGKVKFTIVKDMSNFEDIPTTKAGNSYVFDDIEELTVSVKSEGGVSTTFENLPAKFSVHFDETDDVEDGYQTSSLVCDTLLSLTAGKYFIESYTVYNSSKIALETRTVVNRQFTVSDNKTSDVDVPVAIYEKDEYIKDYYALYEIWKALGGQPDENGNGGWYYTGQDYVAGSNWDFNKDPDLWGDQPGVSLHSNGRVAAISLSGFGFHGHMPAAIGQLTQLVELYLGSHNDSNLSEYDPLLQGGVGNASRMERSKLYLKNLHPATPTTEPIAWGLAQNGITIPATEIYQTKKEKDVLDPATGRAYIQPKDMNHGVITNGLLSLPPEIGNLKKLEQLFIANSEIESLPDEMENLVSCTDIELYNCPNLKTFPDALAKMPSLILLNLANNSQWSASEALRGIKALAKGPSAEKIQMIYFNSNNLEVLPKEIKLMKKLGLLDFSSNKIHTIEEAWGNDIKPVQLYLDNNKLTSFPVNEDGIFCYMEDAENFSARNNKLTEFPDIFTAKSEFTIKSIDFSYNDISGFQNGDNFKGVKVETLTLANNPRITKYPVELAKSNSSVAYVILRGCNVNEVPKGSFDYENSIYLMSLDLSYNDLSDFPWEMHAGNLPYLYGVELSYNKFKSFPWEPLDSQYLTVFAMRGQRDDNGNRCFTEWPSGIYQHRGLRGLYLGSNDIKKVDDTISTICYYLDISDNPNILFDASDICYAIQQGAYILIYDQSQKKNIRNCDILFY